MIDPNKLFQFDRAIRGDNQYLFVGRADEFEEVQEAMLSDTSHLAVYGEMGIGKTSFAWQLLEILEGNHYLLEKLSVFPILPRDKYLCSWTECSTEPKNIYHHLLNTLKSKRNVKNTFRQTFSEVFEDELIERINLTNPENQDDVFALFQDVIDLIRETYPNKQPVLFIDEFDNMISKEGVGKLLKYISNIKFVIVGVADNLDEIIDDHQSSERKLLNSQIELEGLDESDVNALLDRAEHETNKSVRYDSEFRESVFNYSSGFPYLVQFAGFNSIVKFIKSKSDSIIFELNDFNEIFKKVLSTDKNEVRYELIISNIKDYESREAILFELAKSKSWKSKNALLNELDDNHRNGFHNNIIQMIRGKLLKSDEQNRIKFSHPILRAIVRFHSEKEISFIQ